MDPLVILAAVGWLIMTTLILMVGYLSRRELKAIKEKALPLMAKADKALEQVNAIADLQMIPGTIVAGIEKVLTDQLGTQGSALRAYTSALITEGSTAIMEQFASRLNAFKPALNIMNKSFSEIGVQARVDKKEGIDAANAILEQFGPFKGLVEKFIPPSGRTNPMDLIQNLMKAKATLSAFSPSLGAQIDQYVEQAILGGGAPTGATMDLGGIVKMLPNKSQPSSGENTYMGR